MAERFAMRGGHSQDMGPHPFGSKRRMCCKCLCFCDGGGFTMGRFGSLLLLGLAFLMTAPRPVATQEWPNHAVTMVVGFAAAPTFSAASSRASWRRFWVSQQVVTENVGGAAGMVGSGRQGGAIVLPPGRRSTDYFKDFVPKDVEKNAAPIRAAGLAVE
jgi:hypothetical protein